jgi:ammonium transporter Rh
LNTPQTSIRPFLDNQGPILAKPKEDMKPAINPITRAQEEFCIILQHDPIATPPAKLAFSLSVCNSAVAGMLISFGTVLGRLMPSQILFMSVFACFFFTLNQTIVSNILRAVDVGGSISVHIFGAYFGLALSWVLGKTYSLQGINSTVNYHSTMFSMLGTLFLWMFWPSANSGSIYWGSPHDQEIRLWTIINTLLSLTGSCIATFSMSMFFKGKIHMADVLIMLR